MNAKKSLILNIIIVVFILIATIFMYLGVHFMGYTDKLNIEGVGMLQFYTVQSNLFMGIASIIFIVYDILLIKGKINNIPTWVYVTKLTFTVGVSITMLVTCLYLAPLVGASFYALFMNSNLFYHLIVPILSVVTFGVCEKTDCINLRYLPICLLPTLLYGIYYAINAFTHVVDGKIAPTYDWYGFAQGGLIITIIVFVGMLAFAYMVAWGLMKLNRYKGYEK